MRQNAARPDIGRARGCGRGLSEPHPTNSFGAKTSVNPTGNAIMISRMDSVRIFADASSVFADPDW
jgi:hypothetical protein